MFVQLVNLFLYAVRYRNIDKADQPMKILHIIAGAEQGGAGSCAIDTIKALHLAGIDQTVICRPHAAFLRQMRTQLIITF